MAVYAIGDVQGCLAALHALLTRMAFDPARDVVWFTGDLVNRGPDSLGVLRFVKSLGKRAVTVLGNHDLHLLALAAGTEPRKSRDTLDDILTAPDREELLDWLRTRPLLYRDDALEAILVHAGLLPQWDIDTAQALAREAEAEVRDPSGKFFHDMYGDLPDAWDDGLRGAPRLRVIVNALTRLRYCDGNGRMNLEHKGPPGTQPPPLVPWFQVPARRSRDVSIVFGHWSTLGRYQGDGVIALDSGCLWGRALTAVRLDSAVPQFFEVPCPRPAP